MNSLDPALLFAIYSRSKTGEKNVNWNNLDLSGRFTMDTFLEDGPKNPLKIQDNTFRDGHQSLLATRMRTEDMIPIAEKNGYRGILGHGGMGRGNL